MDMQAIKDEIRLNLTGDILEMELSDTSLTKIVNSCFENFKIRHTVEKVEDAKVLTESDLMKKHIS